MDKTNVLLEFWPEGKTLIYDLFEDDGITLDYSNKEEVSYGSAMLLLNSISEVKGTEAILR